MEIFQFHSDAPMLKYCRKLFNGCCFGTLASTFDIIKKTKASNYISMPRKESLKSKVGNRIDFSKFYFEKLKKLKGEPIVSNDIINDS